jgi:ubiquitin-conjugating enzyme E2 D/E
MNDQVAMTVNSNLSDRMATTQRLRNELKSMQKSPPDRCTVNPDEQDVYHWTATIAAPDGTPYEGGVFHLDIRFPPTYPRAPPKVTFVTKIYHPNVAEDGTICVDILKDKWVQVMKVETIMLSLCSLLNEPNAEDPLRADVGAQMKNDRQTFDRIAREMTRNYARG